MSHLNVWRIAPSESLLIGTIASDPLTFRYAPAYLNSPKAAPLSCSLPLREHAYPQNDMLPYFEGLLPEGQARVAIEAELGVRPYDTFGLLSACGKEIVGGIAISSDEPPEISSDYEPVPFDTFDTLFSSLPRMAQSLATARLSLAGAQEKIGLAHIPGTPLTDNWLQPRNGAASTHLLKTSTLNDIPYLEYVCMKAAKALEIDAPDVEIFAFSKPVICVERFDRKASYDQGKLDVVRLHQEDLAQAFGVEPSRKYTPLAPSTASAIAELLKRRASDPVASIQAFARVTCYNYLIGNCDNHLKNHGILYGDSWKYFRFAPAYDIVCTTRFERFSKEMGFALGSSRTIDDITAQDFDLFAHDLGIHPNALREICMPLVQNTQNELQRAAGEKHIETLSYLADLICDDMAARWLVLKDFTG